MENWSAIKARAPSLTMHAMPTHPPIATDLRPLDTRVQPFDTAAARHLLSRAGFGGTPTQIDVLAAQGMDRSV
ncbi:MAG: hypothetical protein RL254_1166, partial [Planctomycetota bacterium]